MISFKQFQQWISVEGDKQRRTPMLDFEPGDVVAFLYRPLKGETAKVQDIFVLMVALEVRSGGGGQGVWGLNLFHIPGEINRDRLAASLKNEEIVNTEIAAELHKSSNTRKAFKYYHIKGIQGMIVKLNREQLRVIL